MKFKKLLVIVPDHLSDLVRKGEITERYYNPRDLFEEVHLLLINDDQPDLKLIQKMAGTGRLVLHNLPPPSFFSSLGWRSPVMDQWLEQGLNLAKKIQPQLIRCHGARLNAVLARQIKKTLGIPYVVSLHINPDSDLRYHAAQNFDLPRVFFYSCLKAIERKGISQADTTICVYRFIEPYAQKMGSKRIEIIYNAINPSNLLPKESYALGTFPRIVIVGRQFKEKDPTPVIRALTFLPEVQLTLIGNGAYHQRLKKLVSQLKLEDRCIFYKSLENDELCKRLKDFDVFISINNYGGVSKVELEAAHVGLPVITNQHPLEIQPEVLGENCIAVDGSTRSYLKAIQLLLGDQNLREKLGRSLRSSVEDLRPEIQEERISELYRGLLRREHNGSGLAVMPD